MGETSECCSGRSVPPVTITDTPGVLSRPIAMLRPLVITTTSRRSGERALASAVVVESPFDRMEMAGYSYSWAGENIAAGSPDAAGTMDQWMGSDGHCSNIMSPNFTEIGVGYYPGGQWGHLWTQAFGS